MNTDIEFTNRLIAEVLDLQIIYDQHMKDNDELLPHVFFGDLTRYVIEKAQIKEDESVSKILGLLEDGLSQNNAEIKNLISASFVENLIDEKETVVLLREVAGPKLLEELVFNN